MSLIWATPRSVDVDEHGDAEDHGRHDQERHFLQPRLAAGEHADAEQRRQRDHDAGRSASGERSPASGRQHVGVAAISSPAVSRHALTASTSRAPSTPPPAASGSSPAPLQAVPAGRTGRSPRPAADRQEHQPGDGVLLSQQVHVAPPASPPVRAASAARLPICVRALSNGMAFHHSPCGAALRPLQRAWGWWPAEAEHRPVRGGCAPAHLLQPHVADVDVRPERPHQPNCCARRCVGIVTPRR